ncbi:MAG: DUF3459 domain-containing protein, partial [Acetobacteraceae bacterium]|nr:DUF3459 domain-containing protein [Acetobacteraceae bacterium]
KILALHRDLLALRHRYIVPRIPGARSEGASVLGPKAIVACWRMGDGSLLSIAINLAGDPVPIGPIGGEMLYGTGERLALIIREGALPERSAAVYLSEASR